MERFCVCVLFILLFSSCKGQREIELVITNRSSSLIDSVVINFPGQYKAELIRPGLAKKMVIDVSSVNSYQEGIHSGLIFVGSKRYRFNWGFHDWGSFATKTDRMYFFEHGINYEDKPLEKPKTFTVFFYNYSNKAIDSIFNSNDAIIKLNERTPRNLEVVYDYQKIKAKPEFLVSMDGRQYRFPLDDHHFDDWNLTREILSFENDSITLYKTPRHPLEFIVDIQIDVNIPADSLGVDASGITKIYRISNRFLRIVFDYAQFKLNPEFVISSDALSFSGDLHGYNFSSGQTNQVLFILKGDGLVQL